jgi:hypothetical protein
MPSVDQLLDGAWRDTVYNTTPLLVIDSGGFELGTSWDAGELYRTPHMPREFTSSEYSELLDRLPPERNVLAVTFDHRVGETPSIAAQANEALAFRDRHSPFMVDLLLKPSTGMYLDIDEAQDSAENFRPFDVIGVTETELGDSLLSRGRALQALRSGLDAAGIQAPIHVFGVLDPILVTFYFMAGGEIFDGLTWIRYGMLDGLAVYRDSVAVLRGRIDPDTDLRTATAHLEFLNELSSVKQTLCAWARSGGDFSLFERWSDALRAVYDRLAVESGGR